jgi:hypothetical protein
MGILSREAEYGYLPCQYLARFFLSVQNRKGEEYEPDTLKCIQSSINRYLGDKTKINIINDIECKHSREVMSAKLYTCI